VKHSPPELRTEKVRVGTALAELTLSFSSGELTGIVGPNGAGKTTLLRCLSGDCLPDEGAVYLDGKDLKRWSAQERTQRLAYLPQNTPFAFPFTISELVGLRAESPSAQEEAIATMELGRLRQHPLTALSGGEQRRAAIARALAQKTPYLLMDEPLSQLDPKHQHSLLRHLQERCEQGTTIVLVLHDLRLARQWCSQLVLLDQGHQIAQGVPHLVLSPETLETTFRIPLSFVS
jgi:iron complex transport system ATP-binding protein